jgi:hypothetical protein
MGMQWFTEMAMAGQAGLEAVTVVRETGQWLFLKRRP